MKTPAVYIMTNKQLGTIYTGVTSNPVKRIYEHKNNITKGFTSRYGCHLLVYIEFHDDMSYAIEREKILKRMSRAEKIQIIESENPYWKDLYEMLL